MIICQIIFFFVQSKEPNRFSNVTNYEFLIMTNILNKKKQMILPSAVLQEIYLQPGQPTIHRVMNYLVDINLLCELSESKSAHQVMTWFVKLKPHLYVSSFTLG